MLDSKYENSFGLQLWLEDVVVTQCIHYDLHPQDLYLEIGNVVQKREDKLVYFICFNSVENY